MRSHPFVLAWVTTGLVGCGFDPQGGDDDASVDGPVDAAADADSDGRPDGQDNCVMVANSDQADEELDGVGDACDKCPHVADAGQANADGDGVGDACDPDPAGPNRIAAFYGFNGSSLPAEWGPVGLWSVSGGVLRQPSVELGNRIIAINGSSFTDMVVDTSFDVVGIAGDVPPNSPERATAVITRFATGTIFGTGYQCSAFQSATDANPASQTTARFENDGTRSGGDIDAMPLRLTAGRNVRMIAASDGDAQSCQTATTSTVFSMFQDNQYTTGTVALRTLGVSANFRYVIVIVPGS